MIFKAAFDRITHNYLLRMLKRYGYKMTFIKLTQAKYGMAFSSLQING